LSKIHTIRVLLKLRSKQLRRCNCANLQPTLPQKKYSFKFVTQNTNLKV